MQSSCVVRRIHTGSKSCAHRVLGMPRREALGDVRADEAGATGEKDAHAGGRASSIERVEIFADYLDDMLTNTARALRTFASAARDVHATPRLVAPLAPARRKRTAVRRGAKLI